jgi:hypothetical protein
VYYYIKGEGVVTNLLGKQKPYSYTLYADKDGNLLTSLDGQRFSLAGPFRFTKHPAADGTFSIYSMSQVNLMKLNEFYDLCEWENIKLPKERNY